MQLAEKPTGEPVKSGVEPMGEKIAKPDGEPGAKPVSKPEVTPGEKFTKPGSQDEIIQRLDKRSGHIEQLQKSIRK